MGLSWKPLRALSGPSSILPGAFGRVETRPQERSREAFLALPILGPFLGAYWSILGAVLDRSRGLRRGRKNAPRAVARSFSCMTHLGGLLEHSRGRLGPFPGPSEGPKNDPRAGTRSLSCVTDLGALSGASWTTLGAVSVFSRGLRRGREKAPRAVTRSFSCVTDLGALLGAS